MAFEDEDWSRFGPLTLLRHTSQLRRGTKTLLDALVEKIPDATDVGLWGRNELAAVTKDSTGKAYNEKTYGSAFFVNSRAKPSEELLSLASKSAPFVATSDGHLLAARVESGTAKPGVISKKDVIRLGKRSDRIKAPQSSLFEGYWGLVESNGLAIAEQSKHFQDLMPLPRGLEVRGQATNIMLEAGAEVEPNVTFDARLGPIIVGDGAAVESFSRIMGPCYIGPKAKIYSALIGGGTSIFESCKVGGQVENSIIMPFTNKAHHGYVGDSYVGSWVNLGAGSTFSNLKNTYGNVNLIVAGKKTDSGMPKLGPVIGDMCKVSIGALVYGGKAIGTGSHVSGRADTDIPSFTYFDSGPKKTVELLLESVLETQRRMMERRGLSLSRNEEALIRRAFAKTAGERKAAGVKKGRF
ncbi:MAG TPA: putative sugar nucleotidyl transferase [Nitrososphaerales archaeon]|nr:putative sugar nucleotidyl transferase [Nitrososphaerales archaeon]